MKRFYGFWFFFCAGWGYLLAQFPPPESHSSLFMAVASFFGGIISFFLLMSIELWRTPSGRQVAGPSLNLKPWHFPFGIPMFALITVLFSSIWGVFFTVVVPALSASHPAQFLSLSVGGLLGLRLCTHVFTSRIAA
jgi:hypothetical protein